MHIRDISDRVTAQVRLKHEKAIQLCDVKDRTSTEGTDWKENKKEEMRDIYLL